MKFHSVVTTGLLLAFVAYVTNGCQSSATPGEESKQTHNLRAVKPVLEPMPNYAWEQTRDNVGITLAVEPVGTAVVYERSLKQVIELFGSGEGKLYTITDRPSSLVLAPEDCALQLHVTNNLSHVLRFHGAVLSLSVDGRAIPLDESKQNEFLRAVLTPYTALDVTIPVAKWSVLQNASTVNFSIYDVITAVDAANNPTKRTTFEWLFAVRPTEVTQDVPVRVTKERMSEPEAQRQPKYVR